MTDTSKLGIGFVLQQEHEKWKTTQAGSKFLSDTESRYAEIEQEMLGVVWAVKKCKCLPKGLPHFEIVTDHNPLVPILNSHRLDEIENPRLQSDLGCKLQDTTFLLDGNKGQRMKQLMPCQEVLLISQSRKTCMERWINVYMRLDSWRQVKETSILQNCKILLKKTRSIKILHM